MKFCFVGLHNWKQSRDLVITDIHPGLDKNYENPIRRCNNCGKKRRWLPGFGGSTIGSWEKMLGEDSE